MSRQHLLSSVVVPPCKYFTVVLLILNTSLIVKIQAAPITFNTALPVAKNAFVNREQFFFKRFKSDTGPAKRNLKVSGLVSVMGYGITPKLALFVAVPYLDKKTDFRFNDTIFSRSTKNIGDTNLFARYTFLQKDERSKTFRIAGFAGIKAPTGIDNKKDSLGRLPVPLQSGSGSWDYLLGTVMTYQVLDFQIDAQLSMQQKGQANNFRAGNNYNADISLQYRILPQQISRDTHGFVYAVIEANYRKVNRNQLSGINDLNSGGNTLFISPGIQYVTPKYILEAAIQIPLRQNLHGNNLETDTILTSGFRINF